MIGCKKIYGKAGFKMTCVISLVFFMACVCSVTQVYAGHGYHHGNEGYVYGDPPLEAPSEDVKHSVTHRSHSKKDWVKVETLKKVVMFPWNVLKKIDDEIVAKYLW